MTPHLLLEGRVYAPVPKTALTEQVAKNPLHCETALQTLIEQADGDYSFLMLKEGWIAAGQRPNRRPTPLLWRKQRHRRVCHQPHSPLETGNRKPHLFSAWELGVC